MYGSDGDESGDEPDNENGNDENGNNENQPTLATFDVSDVSLDETTVAAQASVELAAQITSSQSRRAKTVSRTRSRDFPSRSRAGPGSS